MAITSVAALALLFAAAPQPTAAVAPAGAHYGPVPDGTSPAVPGSSRNCLPGNGNGNDIVVCAQHPNDTQRLPLRDERAEPGEVVRHPSEPPRAAGALNDKPQCQYNCGPSPAKENWGRLFKILKGEDPDD